MNVTAIIPAAGSGTRMGGAKQYMEIAGKPLLEQTLGRIASCDIISAIIIVVPKGDVKDISERYLKFHKVVSIIAGGETRGESVYNGVTAADTEYVLVHDAARPFVTSNLIEMTITAAVQYGAATAAIPVHDTVKMKEDGFVGKLVERASLLLIQTPQAFRRGELLAAYDSAGEKRKEWTDETTLVQNMGKKVAWVHGDPLNMKITTPEDMRIAQMIAKDVIPL
jgi:2-C-methyl-D-erythritol 4-phosphate cytidylyltransferase